MRIGMGIPKIVDRNDLNLRCMLTLVKRAQNITADAPVTIDTYFDCHYPSLLLS
jgi:hypothetical protein